MLKVRFPYFTSVKYLHIKKKKKKSLFLIKLNRYTYMFYIPCIFFRQKLNKKLEVKIKEYVHVKTHQI